MVKQLVAQHELQRETDHLKQLNELCHVIMSIGFFFGVIGAAVVVVAVPVVAFLIYDN